MIYIFLFFVYWVGFFFGSVLIGFCSILGWIWSNGELMLVSYVYVKSLINNYDGVMYLCSYNFCGVLYVVFIVDFEFFDNCCNNILRLFVCFIELFK